MILSSEARRSPIGEGNPKQNTSIRGGNPQQNLKQNTHPCRSTLHVAIRQVRLKPEVGFNSILVRLKVFAKACTKPSGIYCFNSILVRLKEELKYKTADLINEVSIPYWFD